MGVFALAAKIIEVDVPVCMDNGREAEGFRLPEAVKKKPLNHDGHVYFLRPKPTTCPCHRLC